MELFSPSLLPDAADAAPGSDEDAFSEGSLHSSHAEAVDGDSAPDLEDLAQASDLEPMDVLSDVDMVLDSPSLRTDGSDGSASMGLPSDADCDADGQRACWDPGRNCGRWIVGQAQLGAQSQVLLANAYLNLRKLPVSIIRAALEHLLPEHVPAVARNFVDRLAALLFGVAHRLPRLVHDQMSSNGWAPVLETGTGAAGESTAGVHASSVVSGRMGAAGVIAAAPRLTPLTSLKVRVREALAVAHWGRPDSEYVRALGRLEFGPGGEV